MSKLIEQIQILAHEAGLTSHQEAKIRAEVQALVRSGQ